MKAIIDGKEVEIVESQPRKEIDKVSAGWAVHHYSKHPPFGSYEKVANAMGITVRMAKRYELAYLLHVTT